MSVVLVAAGILGAGCAVHDDEQASIATEFVAVPTCAQLDTMLEVSLRQFTGTLYKPENRMQTVFTNNTQMVQGVGCAVTFEDPMPRDESYPAAGPLSRSARIELRAGGESPRLSGYRPSVTPNTIGLSPDGDTRPLPGAGDDSVISSGFDTLRNARQVRARFRIDNIDIDITTTGMDWSGSKTLPLMDSPSLKADLTAGAEQIAATVIQNLPKTLPRSTIDWTLQPTAPKEDPPFTPTPVAVWNPCGIPESALTQAGLDPASKKDSGTGSDEHSCDWQADGYFVSIRSAARRFREEIYQTGMYQGFRPVTVAGRPALNADNTSLGDIGCELAFDAPQSQRYGDVLGLVEVFAWSSGKTGHRVTGRDALCAELTRVAETLVPHLPAGRS